MVSKFLSNEDVQNIITGRADNPFSLLGFHKIDNKKESAVIRVFNPYAQKISVIVKGLSVELPMDKIHQDGLFEVVVGEEDSNYKLLITDNLGKESLEEDVYSFSPVIGEFDNHLLREGNHLDLYKKWVQILSLMKVYKVYLSLFGLRMHTELVLLEISIIGMVV